MRLPETLIIERRIIFMKKPYILVITILVLSLVAASILGGCAPIETSRLKVVTSTSMMAQIVERVGGDMVEVVNIIPPAQCPGHFDVKPGDIQKLADADLFLLHGWQGEIFAQELIASANNPDLTVITIAVKGKLMTPPAQLGATETLTSDYWMTPPVQLEAAEMVTAALCQVDAENSDGYQESAAEFKANIETKGTEIKAKLAKENLASINVMCAEMLIGFVQWTSLNIVATYGRPDSLTPSVVKELVDKGREAKVTLIIDNLQGGQDAGAGIAEELGCKRVILSNFPGGFDNTESWEKAIDRNIELLLEVIAQ
jgi:zinc transport system substrate-binding protein